MRLENVELQPSSGESSDMKTTALYLIKQDHRFLKFNLCAVMNILMFRLQV